MTNDKAANKGFPLPFARVALILAALIAIAAVAIAVLRSRAGDPGPAAPAAAGPVADVGAMIGGLEKKLAANPDDHQGWNLLGLAYYDVGRYADAAKAYAKAAALSPNNPVYWSALGEAQLLSGPGGVTPDALASFRKALALDPKDFRARYFLAVKKDADGDHEGAVDDLLGVLRDSPPDAPWQRPVRDLVTRISSQYNIDVADRIPAPVAPSSIASVDSVATGGIPGPTATDLKAATAMTPAQQDEMARGMVARLAARLEQNPKDADRWIMLMRSRVMLNDAAGAREALAKAKTAFSGDKTQQARFDAAARTLGLQPNP